MIPVFKPYYDQREIDAVAEVLKSGWIGLGPKTKEFEDKFAKHIGSDYAVGVNSATSALHLALKVLGIGQGDEVITTPMTFVSTNSAILYCNAMPVFCDINADTLNIDATKIEGLITPRTKAIICVHFGGYACDMLKILDIAKKYKLWIIEDVAHGCGGHYYDRKLGSIGHIGCFSFHAVKNLATGDGGMLTTNNKSIYEKLNKLRWMGIDKDTYSRNQGEQYAWQYDVTELGYKYHMNDITAALGLVQLDKLSDANYKRRGIVNRYNNNLGAYCDDWIGLPVEYLYQTSACHNYVIKVQQRDELHEYLKKHNISTGVHYIPNNHYRLFKQYRGDTPVSDSVWKTLLTLPLYPDLSPLDVEYIIEKIKSFK